MRSRYWILTIHLENMKKTGLTPEQIYNSKFIAEFLLRRWTDSAPSRTGCVTVCKSPSGLYHAHIGY